MNQTSTPSESRERSYSDGYMALGKQGETIVIDWLRRNPHVLGVSDLRELRIMQEADVDCSIATKDGRIVFAEIKTDKHLGVTDNVLFEVLRINHTAPPDKCVTLGWSARSPAKMLFYYAVSVGKIYYCEFDKLRSVFQKYSQQKRKAMRIDIVPTDNIKTTVNVLIPMSDVKDIFTIIEVQNVTR